MARAWGVCVRQRLAFEFAPLVGADGRLVHRDEDRTWVPLGQSKGKHLDTKEGQWSGTA